MRTSNHTAVVDNKPTKIYLEEFANIREFARACDTRPKADWVDIKSEEHAPNKYHREKLLHGWPEMCNTLKSEVNKLDGIKTQDKKLKQKVYSPIGYYPNVGKALRGNPRCMGKYVKTKVPSKIVEVIWDCGASCRVSSEEVKNQGVQLILKIRSLEMMGYRVRLMVQGFKGDQGVSRQYMARVVIKEENQPLDMARIAYPLANVEMLRTWMFYWYEHLPDSKYINGYGHSLYLWQDKNRKALLDAVNVKANQYYVNLSTDIESMFRPLINVK